MFFRNFVNFLKNFFAVGKTKPRLSGGEGLTTKKICSTIEKENIYSHFLRSGA